MSNLNAYILTVITVVLGVAALASAIFLISYSHKTRRMLASTQSRRSQRKT